jgi:2-alkenal reductase
MRIKLWLACSVALVSVDAPPVTALTADEASTIAAHERVSRSVVLIVVRGVESAESGDPSEVAVTGSGFAIEPGIVVTNYHVVERATTIEVLLQDGDEADAVIIGTAPGFDLALLRVPFDPERLPVAPLGKGVDLRMGQKVLTVSHPLGLWHSLTVGIISGLHRELPGLELGPSLIQFDAPLNPGQSGGPLVDSDGRVVGVTTAKIRGAEAMGLAIPVDIVTRILPDLKEMGHAFRPQVGFSGISVTPDLAKLFDLPAQRGVLVEGVKPESAAEESGLLAGRRHVALRGRDYVLGGDIILAANGEPVRSAEDLMLRFLAARPGETMELSIVGPRGRRKVSLVVPGMAH